MLFKVFISHSTADLGLVYQLKYWLEANGIDAYVAQLNLPPGAYLAGTISQAISECDCFLVLLTRDGARSEWVHEEIGIARQAGRTIVPIVEKGMPVKRMLEGIKYISFDRTNQEEAITETIKLLHGWKLSKETSQKTTATVLLVLGMLAVAALSSREHEESFRR